MTTLIGACAATVTNRATLPDGTLQFELQCSGIQRSWTDCESKAKELCPAGYDTIFVVKAEPGSGMYQYQRAMTVRCKK